MNASDLSPENLARLEEKLKADLEMVQKVRALFKEHLGGAGSMAGPSFPPAVPVAGAGAQPPVTAANTYNRPPPQPDVNVVIREIVAGLTGTFGIKNVKAAIDPKYGIYPDTSVRSVLNRMVQRGDLLIVKHQLGRAGSTYQRPAKGKAQ